MKPRHAQGENIPEEEDQRYLSRLMRSIALSITGETPKPPPVPARPKNDPSESWLNATLVTPHMDTFTTAQHHHSHNTPIQNRPVQAEYKNETHVRSTTKTVELEPTSPKSHNRLSTFLRDLDPSTDSLTPESAEPTPPSSPHRHTQPHQVMLKRSSQLYPLNQSARQLKRHSYAPGMQLEAPPQQHPYPELSRSNSGDNEKFEVNDEELRRLGQVMKRKKEHDAVVRRASMASMASTSSTLSEQELDKGIETARRPRPGVLTRACGCVHLGFAAFMVCTLMLVYNSVLGALVLQASRYPSATNTPVFAFSVLYLTTAALALPGLLSLFLIHRARSMSSLSALPSRLFRSFHWLYLTTALLKLAAMLAWLGINKLQTGAWDHLWLPQSTATTILPVSFSLETLLVQDPADADIWLLNPALWIAGFAAVFAVEVYAWVCLWAYGRRYMLDKSRGQVFMAVEGDHGSHSGSRVNLVRATMEK
ncbi:hypothetical protein BGZ82_006069 [Podila clonocystis]|nr:hypothetical protein BGZ82_006069 [Podila clonocystis]